MYDVCQLTAVAGSIWQEMHVARPTHAISHCHEFSVQGIRYTVIAPTSYNLRSPNDL